MSRTVEATSTSGRQRLPAKSDFRVFLTLGRVIEENLIHVNKLYPELIVHYGYDKFLLMNCTGAQE
jgi:hypothetical protein